MKKISIWLCVISCIVQSTLGAESPKREQSEIMIFSAASLTDVIKDIATEFEKKHIVKVKINIASSGTLARQISQGMQPDVYISASRRWMEFIDSLGYMKKSTIRKVAGNELVLIAPSVASIKTVAIDGTINLMALISGGLLSIGDPTHVPAGKYAKEVLKYFGWEMVLEKKVLPAKDVRSALMVVEMGEAPLGIVYRTDAIKSPKVKVIGTFPPEAHTPIVYMAGVCSGNRMGGLFMEFLLSDASEEIWRGFGFSR